MHRLKPVQNRIAKASVLHITADIAKSKVAKMEKFKRFRKVLKAGVPGIESGKFASTFDVFLENFAQIFQISNTYTSAQ